MPDIIPQTIIGALRENPFSVCVEHSASGRLLYFLENKIIVLDNNGGELYIGKSEEEAVKVLLKGTGND